MERFVKTDSPAARFTFPLILALAIIFAGCTDQENRRPAPPPPRPKVGTGSGTARAKFNPNEEITIKREMNDVYSRLATIILMREQGLPKSSAIMKRNLMEFSERKALVDSAALGMLALIRNMLRKESARLQADALENRETRFGIRFTLEREARQRILEEINILIEKKTPASAEE